MAIAKEDIEKAGSERVIFAGGKIQRIKSASGNGIGGYCVVFSDKSSPDLQGDYFTKGTQFYIDEDSRYPIFYHHGLRAAGTMQLGKAKCRIDDVGVWMEGELALRAEYLKEIGAKKGKAIIKALLDMIDSEDGMGYSTGAMPHLVETEEQENGTFEFKTWGMGEISITPSPVGAATKAVHMKSYDEMPKVKPLVCECEGEEDCECDKPAKEKMTPKKALHELLTQFIADNEEESGQTNIQVKKALAREAMTTVEKVDAMLAGTVVPSNANLKAFSRVLGIDFAILRDLRKPEMQKSIKGIYEDRLAEQQFRSWELYNTYCEVVRLIVHAKVGSDMAATEFDHKAKLAEANTEYATRLAALVESQVEEYLSSSTCGDESFYLRSLVNPSEDDFFSARHIDLADHTCLAVTAFKSVVERIRLNHVNRVKAGRPLSATKLAAAFNYLDSIHTEETKARAFFETMKPKPTDKEKQKAMSDFLRNQISARQNEETVNINERQTESGT